MKRVVVYSDSRARPGDSRSSPGERASGTAPNAPVSPDRLPQESRKSLSESRRRGLIAAGIAAGLVALAAALWLAPRGMNEAQVDAVVQKALEGANAKRLSAADAYEKILPSVVHVRGLATEVDEPKVEGPKGEQPAGAEKDSGNVGTGVVIVDTGIILTNLHVVDGAKRIRVIFHDGMEAVADLIGARPEHDLAVLKAQSVPDDLEPATMRSTTGLRPGEPVVAVGFPFGIGPSASAGVISGLGREYRSAEGTRILTNLIQFDAAVNPGNSGGPLVTNEGEVIGIVTGLLNPTEQRVFVGIGFAVPIENAAAAAGLPPF